MFKFNRTFFQYILILISGILLVLPESVYSQEEIDVQFIILTRADNTVYVMHDQAIPLSHGYHVYRQSGSDDWEQLTDAPIFPVQNGHQLKQKMGRNFAFIEETLERDDPQGIFLSLRAQTDENAVVHAAMPELAKHFGRSFVDRDAPIGENVSYRFEIVNDLERPTGQLIEGSAILTPHQPPAPTNIEVEHEAERVLMRWKYPTHEEDPDTEEVIRFKTFYRDLETGRSVDATDAIMVRTVGDTEFQKYITVPELNREYEFWVEASDFSGQSSPKSEIIRKEIVDNVAPPIIRNVQAHANDKYESEITWPVSTELDLEGYHLYKARGDVEEYTRLTDELLPPLQTSYLHEDTEPGVQYRYAVTAVDVQGNESKRSNPAHVYIWDYRDPDPVQDLNIQFNEEEKKVSLNWEGATGDVPLRTFQILRRQINPQAGSTYDQLNDSAYTELNFTDNGYDNDGFREGATFEYGIVAVAQNGNRSDTVFTDIQIPVLTPPEPPTSIETRMQNGQRIQINWTASTSLDVTSYKVYRQINEADTLQLLAERDRGQRIFRDEEIDMDTEYRYSVTAVDSAGNESEPALSELMKAHRLHPPSRTRNVSAVETENGVELQWQVQNIDEINGFRIYRSNIATGIFEVIAETDTESLSYTDADSEAGQWFKVFPFDNRGREARTATPVQAVRN